MRSKPRSLIAVSIRSSVSRPSGSATRVSRAMCFWKFWSIVSRQSAIAGLHSQDGHRLEFGQDPLTFAKLVLPGSLLILQPAEPVLSDLGQADAVQRLPAHLEGVLALVLLPLESLPVPGMQLVESGLPLPFGFRPE